METTINKSGIWDSSTDHVDSIILDGTSSPITLQINTGTTSWGEGDNADSPFTANALTIEGNVTLAGNGYLANHGNLTNNGSLTITNPNFSVNGTLSGQSVTIKDGGALTVGSLDAPVTFGDSSADSSKYNTLTVTNYAQTITINNLSPRDKIIFTNGVSGDLSFDSNGNIVDQNGIVAKVTFAKGYDSSDYHFDGQTVTVTCFLTGSMIRTSKGDVAVEDIQIGDKLVAVDFH